MQFFCTAALRIDKWLKWKSNCHSPPSLHLPAPPFSMVTREMLFDKDAVLNIVMSDITLSHNKQGEEEEEKLREGREGGRNENHALYY